MAKSSGPASTGAASTGSEPTVRDLAAALDRLGTGRLAVVTGAGISLASGIPTFRGDDPDAVWHRDVLEKGTYGYFRRHPVDSWTWSLSRFLRIPDAEPNAAHFAVETLCRRHRERGGRAQIVTQNIDSLHERAGSDDVIKVHGSIARVRCASDLGCPGGAPNGSKPAEPATDFRAFLEDPSEENLPRCEHCGDFLRPHVLWFDEFYADHRDFRWLEVQQLIREMELLLFVGTSFSVGVTDAFLQSALMRGVPVWSIDPSAETPAPGVHRIRAKAEVALPELVGD